MNKKSYVIHENLLLLESDFSQNYEIQFNEWTFTFKGREAVIFHKWTLKEMYVKEISNWMLIPYLKEKKEYHLDSSSLRSWIALYRRFDENTWSFSSYAYKVKKEKIPFQTEIMNHLWLDEQLITGKFIEITNTIEEKHFHSVSWVEQSLSLLLWIALIYWKFTLQDNRLLHTTIQLPLVENIASYEEKLVHIIDSLKEQWFFMITNHIQQKSWQLLQISIWDEEILSLWAWWMWYWTMDLSEYKTKISEIYWWDLSNYVLKFLHK